MATSCRWIWSWCESCIAFTLKIIFELIRQDITDSPNEYFVIFTHPLSILCIFYKNMNNFQWVIKSFTLGKKFCNSFSDICPNMWYIRISRRVQNSILLQKAITSNVFKLKTRRNTQNIFFNSKNITWINFSKSIIIHECATTRVPSRLKKKIVLERWKI